MAVQEVDLNDIYEELIKLKDTLDKIEDIYDKITHIKKKDKKMEPYQLKLD